MFRNVVQQQVRSLAARWKAIPYAQRLSKSSYRYKSNRPFARNQQQYQRFGGASPGSSFLHRWASHPHFYQQVTILSFAAGGFYVYNLEEVPVSHRRRFNILSEELEEQLVGQIDAETKAQYRGRILSEHDSRHQMVQRVASRLISHSGLMDKKWEVHIIDDPQKNAFVVPGGKIFVFTGILDVCAGDAGMATVLSHEISHTIARHSAERMSQMFAVAGPVILLLTSFGIDPGLSRLLVDLGYSRPGSRTQESEADYIGLMMMSESCYDPNEAILFWQRMQQAEKFEPPQFLSTHPNNDFRVGQMQKWLPEAQDKYQAADCAVMSDWMQGFQRQIRVG